MFVCVYIYICIYTYVYTYINIYVHTYISEEDLPDATAMIVMGTSLKANYRATDLSLYIYTYIYE